MSYLRGADQTPFWLVQVLSQVLPGSWIPGFLFVVGLACLYLAWWLENPKRRMRSSPPPEELEQQQWAAESTESDPEMIARITESFDPRAADPVREPLGAARAEAFEATPSEGSN